jgi:hypothetical protein
MKAVILCLVTLTAVQPICVASDVANYLAARGGSAYDSKAKFTMPARDTPQLCTTAKAGPQLRSAEQPSRRTKIHRHPGGRAG